MLHTMKYQRKIGKVRRGAREGRYERALGGNSLGGKMYSWSERKKGRKESGLKAILEREGCPVLGEESEKTYGVDSGSTVDLVEVRYLQWGNLYQRSSFERQEGMGETGLTQCLGDLGLEVCRTGII